LPESIDRYRREQALGALTDCDGDVTRAARQLGISYQAMRKLILKYELRGVSGSDLTGRPGLQGRGPRRPRR
jgi:DNA-binding NtrC family response regulator